jgi:predicted TIM-barrel fold metal-dependent hydrolase
MSKDSQSSDTQATHASALAEVNSVIDADSQIQEDLDEITKYIDDSSAAKSVFEYAKAPNALIYGNISTYSFYDYKREGPDGAPRLNDRDVGEAIGLETVAQQQDDLGIDKSIVNPTVNLGLAEVNNQRFAVAIASAYNDWLVEQLDDYDDLVGNMVVAPHEPEMAAEEIDRMATEDSIVGLELPATGLTPPPGYKQYRPIYGAAQKNGLPISMHGVVSLKTTHQQYYSSESYAEDWVNHASWVHMRNLVSLLFEGIPEFYPELDFVIHGMGTGYVPYIISRLDDHYLELSYELPALSQAPSNYFKDSFYWSTYPLGKLEGAPAYTAKNIDMAGTENVVYASDIPHPVSDTPTDLIESVDDYLDQETINGIMGGTISEVYDL